MKKLLLAGLLTVGITAPGWAQQVKVRHKLNQNSLHPPAYLLQGAWSDCSDCNAIYIIKGNRVIFFDHIGDVEHEKEYRTYWKISGNKLSFCYSGGLVVTDDIVKLTKDSLVTYHKRGGFGRYVRLK